MRVEQKFSLQKYNTFALDVRAKYYIEIHNEQDVLDFLDSRNFASEKLFILGGGSNVLFLDDFDGVVLNYTSQNVQVVSENQQQVTIKVDAGIAWHKLVEFALQNGFYGLENLALIPGRVGGAVVQNIGAYGVELKEFVESVSGINLRTGEFETFDNAHCRFAYRNSIFKSKFKNTLIITRLNLKLSKIPRVNILYKDLQNVFNKDGNIEPNPKYVFETVCSLRRSKLPDVKLLPNCGSFFKNPIVDETAHQLLKGKHPDLVSFPTATGQFKVSAGWLIEKAGWKGRRIGNVGTYDRHALIIVNYGAKKGSEIYEFADTIRSDVFEKFGILLENEVEIVGN
jgi:UDP-N-acetylmuramate dehydrogenase